MRSRAFAGCGCRPSWSGSGQRAATTADVFPGATNGVRTSPPTAAACARRCRSGTLQRTSARTGCATAPATSGSGARTNTRPDCAAHAADRGTRTLPSFAARAAMPGPPARVTRTSASESLAGLLQMVQLEPMIAFVTSERFAFLDAKDRDRLEALAKLDQFSDGQEVSASGTPSEWLSLIVSGGVDLRTRTKDGEITLARLGPGDIYGELETFADLPEGVRHVARGETIVRAINKHPLKQELKVHRSLASGILAVYCRSISEKVRAANEVATSRASGLSRQPAPMESRPPHLTGEEVAWLSLLGKAVSAAGGEVVVREGDVSRSFYVVASGEL